VKEKIYETQSYNGLTVLLKEFLQELEGKKDYPVLAVLGICGPVDNNKVEILANIKHWNDVNGDELAKSLKMKKVILVNDFACNGYGILSDIKEGEDYEKLNNVPASKDGVIAIIGAGTGLGHGFVVKNSSSQYHEVYSSEGGHQDFAPQSELEWEYYKYLQKFYNVGHVSVERACSGPVIKVIFQFFVEREKITSSLLKGKEYADLKNEEILDAGLDKSCQVCVKTVELFTSIYGSAAGNMALVTMPFGGIFLTGGLTVKLANYIINGKIFHESFVKKGRVSSMMEKFPLFVVKNPHIGVNGSREYARRLLEALN